MIDLEKAIGVWFMDVSDTSNWLAAVSRTEDGKLLLQWRMRYYEKGSPPDSNDEKRWYQGTSKKTEAEAIENMRFIGRTMTQHAEGKLYEVLRGDRSIEEFAKEFCALPFVHATVVETKKNFHA